MGGRVALIFLLVLCASWVCEPRLIIFESPAIEIGDEGNKNILLSEEVSRNENVCTLCEEFASQALDYISENKTQTEIIETLHMTCSRVPALKQQVSSVGPEDFCRKINLCEKTATSSMQSYQDSCGVCHTAASEILIKLKDPDTQLEVIELLLKACNSAGKKYVKKCKKMVFEYGPVIFVDAEQFLETTDICTILHACNTDCSEQASHSDS